MYLKNLNQINIKGKNVLLRVDLNVPLENGKVTNDYRIKAIVPTVDYLINAGAKVILVSHLGRPNGRTEKLSMERLVETVAHIFKKKVIFVDDCIGDEVKKVIKKNSQSHVILLENLRFYPEEELNDSDFAKELASIADIYVNEAFSVCHRNNASVVGITDHIPSFAGFLLMKEINVLDKALENPDKPLMLIMGGAKAETKIRIIRRMLKKADKIILGGVLANIVLKEKGINIGKSETFGVGIGSIFDVKDPKIMLPKDVVVSINEDEKDFTKEKSVRKIEFDEKILDIGQESVEEYIKTIQQAKMIIWNGPMGFFEKEAFSYGTKRLAKAIASSEAYTIVGGGDTIAALQKFNLLNRIKHISTGGGAMLTYLEGDNMPGIDALS